MTTTVTPTTQCSFCLKQEQEVAQLVAGPGVFICDECVQLCGDIFAAGQAEKANGAGGPGDRTEASLPYWEAMSDDELVAQLPRIASVAVQIDDHLHAWVGRARDRGVSWARIGRALGISRQSAWERFSQEG